MIDTKNQEELFILIGNTLKKHAECYAIGGTAMLFFGAKDNTKDIDLVFLDEENRDSFIAACKELDYSEMSSFEVYGGKKNKPIMLTKGNERFDLFIREVVNFTLSDTMIKRFEERHDFGKNLAVNIANHNDIVILKCATDRKGDKVDIMRIYDKFGIDWNLVYEECLNQEKIGRKRAVIDLYETMVELDEEYKLKIPIEIFNKVEDKIEEKLKKYADKNI